MDFIESLVAKRLGGINFRDSKNSYKFTMIKNAKIEAIGKHQDISLIDMGIGEPDLPADSDVVKILSGEAGKRENRWYADNGIREFNEAASKYLYRVYGLKKIDPSKNIMHGIGCKSILAMLPLCFINCGDISLVTIPGYSVISTYTKYVGGQIYNLPLLESNNFYPDFSNIPDDILRRSKLLYINYPNNPTGQIATKEFYSKVVEFAYKNNIIVVSDAAYSAITFDGYDPLSFLSIDGAEEVGVELHSLSKAFNMTGWRLGFIAGNSKIIEAYGIIKGNTDSGQFRAIQKSGIYALNHLDITRGNCDRYSRRFDLLIPALREAGFSADKPKGTFYCYVNAPKGTESGIKFKNAEQASEYIIKNALISTVPWDDAGAYLRFSVTFEANGYEDEKKIVEDMKNRLINLRLIF